MTSSTFLVIKRVSYSTQVGIRFQLLINGKMVLMLKHEPYLASVAASKPTRCIITEQNLIKSELNKISS